MATKVAASAAPWTAGFSQVQSAVSSMTGWNPRATATLVRTSAGSSNFSLLANDVGRAYACALYWKVTGSTAHADKALSFMNAWSSTLTGIQGNIDIFLLSLNAYQFANVGEIMRTYSGCTPANLLSFQTMMHTYFYPNARDGLYGSLTPLTVYSNWQLSCIAALMSIGVLCDDSTMYNDAVNYFKTGTGNGGVRQAVYFIHPGYLGQTQESGRDQGHNTLSVGLLGVICEMAWNQGMDLYSYDNNRVLAGCEYVAKGNQYESGTTYPVMPFTLYKTTNIYQDTFATGSQGLPRNEWSVIYNHYVNRMGLAAPYVKSFHASRTETTSDNDLPGFGTLTYAREAYAGNVAPSGLTATVTAGVVTLSWWGSAYATSYTVKRSTTPCSGYTTLGTVSSGSALTYADTPAAVGTYYYVVSATTPSGETVASNQVVGITGTQLLLQLPMNEGSGTTTADATGHGYTGTLVNATWGAGRTGSAVSLNGINGYISLPDGLLSDLGDCTISLWTYWTGNSSIQSLFAFGLDGDHYINFCPQWSDGNAKFYIATNARDGADWVLGSTRLAGYRWTHVAVTFSGTSISLYLDGNKVNSNTSARFQPFRLGSTTCNWIGRSLNSNSYYSGLVDDLRIYRGALSDADITTLAAS